jgi:hypothetical protein
MLANGRIGHIQVEIKSEILRREEQRLRMTGQK